MNNRQTISNGDAGGNIWLGCNCCKNATSHTILARIDTSDESTDGDIRVWSSYLTVVCDGCKTVSFCVEDSDSESYDYRDGHEVLDVRRTQFPNQVTGRPELTGAEHLPNGVCHIYRETLTAIGCHQRVLAGIGVRAIVEAVCKDRRASGTNLETRINELVALGLITNAGAEILHGLRFMGNAAAHEVKTHTTDELLTAITVVENLLQNVYILPILASKLPKQRN